MNSNQAMNCHNCPAVEFGIFCDRKKSTLSKISEHKIPSHFKKGQTLFVQGNHPHGLFCIKSGNIKVTKMGDEGKESIVRIVKGGDILGHRSLFSNQHYMLSATAMDDTNVCFIDKKIIVEQINSDPDIALQMIKKLSLDMGAAESKAASFHQKNVRERLAELLLLLKDSHGKMEKNGQIKINLILTREEMATMIGTASETLIRFIKEFKEEGILNQEGKTLIIVNIQKLSEFASPTA